MKKTGLADSPFFTAPSQVAEVLEGENVLPSKTERNSERTVFRTEKRTVDLPTKRRTKRYSFEFYEDQITKLKTLKYQSEMAGENLKLSDMAREALDQYLKDKTS
jgi:hypothetical protein